LGHTPLFNAVLSDANGYMTRRLLDFGADVHLKATLRKYLDWNEEPRRHIAKNVTPLEWAASFPEREWVSREAVSLIEKKEKS